MILRDSESFEKIQLLLYFLGTFNLELSGNLCVGYINKEAFEKTGCTKDDTGGLVDYTRVIDGVKIGALLEESDGYVKGSLRSKDSKYRVDLLAKHFNGGGHACASGFGLQEDINHFYPRFIEVVKAHLETISPEQDD